MDLQILEDIHAIQAKEANKPVDDLNAKYTEALEKYRDDSQAAGKLDAVLAANAALVKLAAGQAPGDSSDAGVANLEKSYLAKLPAARAEGADNTLKVEREYRGNLITDFRGSYDTLGQCDVAGYDRWIAKGLKAHPELEKETGKRGRGKQSKEHNLLMRMEERNFIQFEGDAQTVQPAAVVHLLTRNR